MLSNTSNILSLSDTNTPSGCHHRPVLTVAQTFQSVFQWKESNDLLKNTCLHSKSSSETEAQQTTIQDQRKKYHCYSHLSSSETIPDTEPLNQNKTRTRVARNKDPKALQSHHTTWQCTHKVPAFPRGTRTLHNQNHCIKNNSEQEEFPLVKVNPSFPST